MLTLDPESPGSPAHGASSPMTRPTTRARPPSPSTHRAFPHDALPCYRPLMAAIPADPRHHRCGGWLSPGPVRILLEDAPLVFSYVAGGLTCSRCHAHLVPGDTATAALAAQTPTVVWAAAAGTA